MIKVFILNKVQPQVVNDYGKWLWDTGGWWLQEWSALMILDWTFANIGW